MTEECCGTCKYHYYDIEDKEWVCDNKNSDYYSDYTSYSDSCEEYEER